MKTCFILTTKLEGGLFVARTTSNQLLYAITGCGEDPTWSCKSSNAFSIFLCFKSTDPFISVWNKNKRWNNNNYLTPPDSFSKYTIINSKNFIFIWILIFREIAFKSHYQRNDSTVKNIQYELKKYKRIQGLQIIIGNVHT